MSGNKRGPYAVTGLTPNRIREHRIARGLTQADVARALGLSPTSGYIGNLESGRQPLPTEHASRIADIARILGVTEWELLRWSRPELRANHSLE
ncbi:MAG: helix-turn-helix domain-containing protein [Chloroflexota bacterium]|nr:helix-turn-helix domain-containing protein [Chloroflexota bacterium]